MTTIFMTVLSLCPDRARCVRVRLGDRWFNISNCGHPITSKLFYWNENRGILVFEQEHQELGWHGPARIATNGVNIGGVFVKGLSGRGGYGLPAVHAHDDAAFQDLDEGAEGQKRSHTP